MKQSTTEGLGPMALNPKAGIVQVERRSARHRAKNPRRPFTEALGDLLVDYSDLDVGGIVDVIETHLDGLKDDIVQRRDAKTEIDRLRATLLNIQALAERGLPLDCPKLAQQCRHGLNPEMDS